MKIVYEILSASACGEGYTNSAVLRLASRVKKEIEETYPNAEVEVNTVDHSPLCFVTGVDDWVEEAEVERECDKIHSRLEADDSWHCDE